MKICKQSNINSFSLIDRLQKSCMILRKTYKKVVGDFVTAKAKKLTRYTNIATGEYAERTQFVDLQFDEEGYLFWNRKANVKTFVEIPLPECFTWAERGRINELKHYILRDNQFLVYRSDGVIKPITAKEMCNIFDMSERQCKCLIKKMKLAKIIKEIAMDGLTYYAFNPIFGFKEKRLSLNVFLFFQEELTEVLPNWVIKKFAESAIELRPNFKIIK